MRSIVCELGGYEALLRGNADDARRAVAAKAHEHGPVTIHDDSLQRAITRLAEAARLGYMYWGSARELGREPTLKWFNDHNRDGSLKPEAARIFNEVITNAVKELSE